MSILAVDLFSSFVSSEFFKNFLPNFVSTVLGLLLGLPIALWTNRLILAQSEKTKRMEEIASLDRSLVSVIESLNFNRQRFSNMLNTLANNQVHIDPALDYSTWDAVQQDIIQYLAEPFLQRRIAYHFSRLRTLVQIQSMYLDSITGITASLWDPPPLRQNLKTLLPNMITKLDEEADALIKDINLIRERYAKKLPKDSRQASFSNH